VIIVITGSNGFTAKYLAEYIKSISSDHVIYGIDLASESRCSSVDKYFSIAEMSQLFDYLNHSEDKIKVFHLAGLLKSGSIEKLIEVNVLGTAKYIELFKKLQSLLVFVNIGSSSEYGIQEEKQLNENLAPNPVLPYGISKLLQSELVLCSSKIYDFKAITTRTFNLIGPGLSVDFIIGRLVNEFIKIKNGEKEFCEIGRTDSIRNFIDVRNAVKIYWELSEKGESGAVYNVGHPESYSIDNILNILSSITGTKPKLKNINSQVSKSDINYQYADLGKTMGLINKFTYLKIEESLRNMVNYNIAI